MPIQLNTSYDIFLEMVGNLQASEEKLSQAIPEISRSITNPSLQQIIADLGQSSANRTNNLNQIGQYLNTRIENSDAQGIESLINDSQQLIKKSSANTPIDVGLAASLQTILSYIIYYYSYASNIAKSLNLNQQISQILGESFSSLESINNQLSQTAAILFEQLSSQKPNQPNIDTLKQQVESTKQRIDQLSQQPPNVQQSEMNQLQQQLNDQQQQIDQLQTSPTSPQQVKNEQTVLKTQAETQQHQLEQASPSSGRIKQKLENLVDKITK